MQEELKRHSMVDLIQDKLYVELNLTKLLQEFYSAHRITPEVLVSWDKEKPIVKIKL